MERYSQVPRSTLLLFKYTVSVDSSTLLSLTDKEGSCCRECWVVAYLQEGGVEASLPSISFSLSPWFGSASSSRPSAFSFRFLFFVLSYLLFFVF